MKNLKFRKLKIDLQRKPVVNQRPWIIAGWLLVMIVLLFAAWSYFSNK
jgi:hypothetical protein